MFLISDVVIKRKMELCKSNLLRMLSEPYNSLSDLQQIDERLERCQGPGGWWEHGRIGVAGWRGGNASA